MDEPGESADVAGADGDALTVTLHSSWFGIAMASAGVLILLVGAVAMISWAGLTVVTAIVAALAVVGAVVVLFDMPIATTFDAEGVVRRTPLRRHRIAWDDIDRVIRARKALAVPGRSRSAGLVATRGPRQYLLVDRMEGRREYDGLVGVLGSELAGAVIAADPPPDNRTPTWVGRRAKWRPPSA